MHIFVNLLTYRILILYVEKYVFLNVKICNFLYNIFIFLVLYENNNIF